MRRSLLVPYCCLFMFTLFPSSSLADTASYGYGGYIRNFFTINDSSDNTEAADLARFRLRINYNHSETIASELAYELVPSLGQDIEKAFSTMAPSRPFLYRVFDLDERIYPGDNDTGSDFILAQNLDRASVTLSREDFDLYIGRQPIAFGSARVINPTDILAPYTYNTLAKDERIGVDAVRVKIPTQQLGELDIGYVFGDEFRYDESAAFIRVRSYVLMTDVTVMAMVFRDNFLLGLDIARSIGGAGTWLEAAYVFAQEGSDENYLSLSAGSDYSFTEKLYAYLEYHFNGAGRDSPDHYFRNTSGNTAFTDGAVYLLARHYLAPGVTYQVSPLLIFSGQALINMNDGSFLFSPVFEYSFADDISGEMGAYIGVGEESADPLTPESEFGLYSDTYFISLSLYF